ncbi:hypothetical protein K8353_51000, partial [Burkholderia contaminans]|nr:hypothetical protein [Burkholderia contaminans]
MCNECVELAQEII